MERIRTLSRPHGRPRVRSGNSWPNVSWQDGRMYNTVGEVMEGMVFTGFCVCGPGGSRLINAVVVQESCYEKMVTLWVLGCLNRKTVSYKYRNFQCKIRWLSSYYDENLYTWKEGLYSTTESRLIPIIFSMEEVETVEFTNGYEIMYNAWNRL